MVAAALEIDDDLPIVRYTIGSTPSTGPFAVPFPLPTDYAAALFVAIDGVETTDFTFTPDSDVAGGYPTGEVTLTYAQSNCQVTIWRRLPLERTTDYANGPLDMAGLNAELAYTIMRLQDTRLRATQVWRTGSGAPADADGLDGDMYINVTNGDLYGPKALGAWGSAIGNLVDDVSAAAIDAAATAAIVAHVALSDPHTQYLLESAVSANGLTLIGQTFANMRTSLGLGALALLATVGTSQIDNDAVTYAKMQNVSATSRILGRISASAGDVEELTAANVKTILALAQADISGLTTASTPTFAGLNITGSATLDGGVILNENDFIQLRSTSYRVLFGNDNVNVAFYKQNGSGTYISTPLNLALSDDKWTMAGALDVGGPIGLKSYTVAGLPAGSTAQIAYASNGRKNGEGAGAGTGVVVFKDGTAWRACDTGATVAA